jgi:hypothetical protein
MSLSKSEIQKLLDVVRSTRPLEIDCDVCLIEVGEFAELHVAGRSVPEALKAVEQHLMICDECRQEFELLCLTLQG